MQERLIEEIRQDLIGVAEQFKKIDGILDDVCHEFVAINNGLDRLEALIDKVLEENKSCK